MKEDANFWLYGLGSGSQESPTPPPPPPPGPPDITGGTIYDLGGYRYHVFDEVGSFTLGVTAGYGDYPRGTPVTAQVLVVGGGGAGYPGGNHDAGTTYWTGGGGGGGIAGANDPVPFDGTVPSVALSVGSYAVTVGAGATKIAYASAQLNGGSSSIVGPQVRLSAFGGGGGAGGALNANASGLGANGGGAAVYVTAPPESSPFPGGYQGGGAVGYAGGPRRFGDISQSAAGGGAGMMGNGTTGKGGPGWIPPEGSHWLGLFAERRWKEISPGGFRSFALRDEPGSGPQTDSAPGGNAGMVVVAYSYQPTTPPPH